MKNKLNILIINHLFFPDQSALSQVITDLSLGLSDQGFDISVICSKFEQVKNLDDKLPENHQIKIEYVSGTNYGKSTFIGRLIDYITFYLFSLWHAVTKNNPDIVITTTAPPFIGLVGVVMKIFKGSKFIYYMQDVYPQTAIKLGVLRSTIVIRFYEYLLRLILRYSDWIVVIGEDMYDSIKRVYNFNNISIIHNWADGEDIKPIEMKDNIFIKQYNLHNKFIVMYSGNFGLAHEFIPILTAAEEMKSLDAIQFILIGEGKLRSVIEKVINEKNLHNVYLFPFQTRAMLKHSITAADISLISLIDGLEGYIVPSKIYRLLAAGRSIIFLGSSKSVISQIIENAHCGYTVNNNNVKELVQIINNQFTYRELNKQLGNNARKYFEHNYQRTFALEKFYILIKKISAS
ncbi:MAG: glycosyltransferase family 4 protein [Bacteroidota bacterium]|jgi:glycosyltransferase involved in cell wall biosynthesis